MRTHTSNLQKLEKFIFVFIRGNYPHIYLNSLQNIMQCNSVLDDRFFLFTMQ